MGMVSLELGLIGAKLGLNKVAIHSTILTLAFVSDRHRILAPAVGDQGGGCNEPRQFR